MTDLDILRDFYREKLADTVRHIAGARNVRQYDANNTYQYIINREETQLSWVSAAIIALDGTVDDLQTPPAGADASAGASARGNVSAKAEAGIEADDARGAQAFVDRWESRISGLNDDRHGRMLRVILGETLEQKRFFEQALAGRTDLLGLRGDAAGARVGEVLPVRWIE